MVNNRRRATAAVGLAAAVVIAGWSSSPGQGGGRADGANGDPVEVVAVVDGDTVRLRIGPTVETVRLLGIDTPESVHPTVPIQCFGPEATEELSRLLPPGTAVDVYRDRELRDHFGRMLLYVIRSDDDLDVNLELVERGFGAAAFYEPNVFRRSEFLGAERRARRSGTGLWGVCDGPDQPLE